MGADYAFYMKTIETHARAFLPLNISAAGTVLLNNLKNAVHCALHTVKVIEAVKIVIKLTLF